jgi:hypothetical protein
MDLRSATPASLELQVASHCQQSLRMAGRGACGAAFSAFAAIGQLLGQVGQRLIPVPTPASFNNLGMQGGAFKLQDRGIIRLNIQNYQLLQPQYCYLSCYTIAHLVSRTDTSGYWIFNRSPT